ncbi:ORF126 [Agrotis segetum granulovirus]|uniref:Lef-10 n=1 Tax=Agrotis segetum granulosis virus TaxID=10464 RepID=Q6QXI6_GVAS|nr:lef-10 [Agrotis segetum granulovirus]AAS82612.1 ORF126 [Agrotis segetum granulovirus]AHN92178.1 lef-10 [Agrotis segetum granulovirus]AKN63415.1 lef-10 [Agrotis segetum granulovirus]
MSEVTDHILKNNVCIIDNKYLIFYVISPTENAVFTTCYGTIDTLPTYSDFKESVSVSSKFSDLSSDSNNGKRKGVL